MSAMSGIELMYIAGLFIAVFIVVSVFLNYGTHRKLQRFATRKPLSLQEKEMLFDPMPLWIVDEICQKIFDTVRHEFPVKPQDHPVSDYDIDIEDLFDIIDCFIAKYDLQGVETNIKISGEDPTLKEVLELCTSLYLNKMRDSRPRYIRVGAGRDAEAVWKPR